MHYLCDGRYTQHVLATCTFAIRRIALPRDLPAAFYTYGHWLELNQTTRMKQDIPVYTFRGHRSTTKLQETYVPSMGFEPTPMPFFVSQSHEMRY